MPRELNEHEQLALKAAAIDVHLKDAKEAYETEFKAPLKAWLKGLDPDGTTTFIKEIIGKVRLSLVRTKDKASWKRDDLLRDLIAGARTGTVTSQDILTLLEGGILGVNKDETIADLLSNRLGTDKDDYIRPAQGIVVEALRIEGIKANGKDGKQEMAERLAKDGAALGDKVRYLASHPIRKPTLEALQREQQAATRR